MEKRLKNIKYGNVSANLRGRKDFSFLKRPVTVQQTNVSFNQGQKKDMVVEPFEINTGIINDRPEIILLSDFTPVYDDQGKLNKVGDIFQVKQDSLLVSSNSSINALINSDVYPDLLSSAESNKQDIYNFSIAFGESIDNILKNISKIKEKFDCRIALDKDDLLKSGIILSENKNNLNQKFLDLSPSTIEDILFEKDINVISNWTKTKVWIQLALELKESFRNGLPILLANSNSVPVNSSDLYNSPYNIVRPRSSFVDKARFYTKKDDSFSLSDIRVKSDVDISNSIKKIKHMFAVNSSKSILNKSVYSNTDNLYESISRLAFLICKEYVFSTKMNQSVLSDYDYTLNVDGSGNFDIWNSFFGKEGNDITEIFTNPVGNGKSLISLSQFIEADNVEVLTFEDSYIKDDVGLKRPAVMTPGVFYYVESSLNIANDSFDTVRLESYISRLKSAINMLLMLKNNLSFNGNVNPYLSVFQKVTKYAEVSKSNNSVQNNTIKTALQNTSRKYKNDVEELYRNISSSNLANSDGTKTDDQQSLDNPILLLRSIEQKLLVGSYLLNRKHSGPKLWTDRNIPSIKSKNKSVKLINSSEEKKPSNALNLKGAVKVGNLLIENNNQLDVSPLLISASLQDAELMSLLFLYVMNKSFLLDSAKYTNVSLQAEVANSGKFSIAQKIVSRLHDIYKSSGNSNISTLRYFKGSTEIDNIELYNALVDEDPRYRKILDNIADFINELSRHFLDLENESSILKRFFLNSANPLSNTRKAQTSDALQNLLDKRTLYSGLQKTVYISSIFQLCCLVVHSANPERIFSMKPGMVVDKYFIGLLQEPVLEDNQQIKKFEDSGLDILPLVYDSTIVKCESILDDYNSSLIKNINRVYGFIYSLHKELDSFSKDLNNKFSEYSLFFSKAKSLIKDPALVRLLMSEEQMLLIRSKFYDIQTRTNASYDSEIKRVIPYFMDFQNDQSVDTFLPIEDLHLISWNLFLKSFLRSKDLRESEGFNKKIISIGIPQSLQKFLQKNASKLSNSEKNKLIRINLFRVNELKPSIVYKPLTYLFDLNTFSTRILKSYIDAGFSINSSEDFSVDKFPFLNHNFSLSKDKLSSDNFFITNNKNTFNYSFLTKDEKDELIKNHSTSFLMEEYLNYFAGTSFDEHKYFRYEPIKQMIDTEFSKFVKEISDIEVEDFNSSSIENFFVGETFLSNANRLMSSLIMPKKFDRVFHILFDPDDFIIDANYSEESKDKMNPGMVSFDKYYIAIESYDESK